MRPERKNVARLVLLFLGRRALVALDQRRGIVVDVETPCNTNLGVVRSAQAIDVERRCLVLHQHSILTRRLRFSRALV